jgi:thioredoxin 1
MTKEDFNGPRVLVDFWAQWCGPCKMMKPRMERFAKDNPEIEVIFCNVDEEHGLAQEYGIRSIPTLMYMEDGEIVGKKIGNVDDKQITELVNGVN